jgi:hypothetical protein
MAREAEDEQNAQHEERRRAREDRDQRIAGVSRDLEPEFMMVRGQKIYTTPYANELAAIPNPNPEQDVLQSTALQLQGRNLHSLQNPSRATSHQGSQSQRVSAHDRLGPDGARRQSQGGRRARSRLPRRARQGRSESRPPVYSVAHNPPRNNRQEGGAESEYRGAEAPDSFPCFAPRLLSLDRRAKSKASFALRNIMAAEPAVPKYLDWSKHPIQFSREDQWTSVDNAGHYPLVLDPTIAGMTVTKVLIDGGAGLNIIFADTLKKIGLDFAGLLTPTDVPLYGIVPGKAAMPLGQITLPVTFGTLQNYRTEFIKFEVADFESSYHAIFGRLTLAKFLAVPHHPYLLLKMPGPKAIQI